MRKADFDVSVAALNHPTSRRSIYGLETSSVLSALVMELVGGEDLSQRTARGPIALDEAADRARLRTRSKPRTSRGSSAT